MTYILFVQNAKKREWFPARRRLHVGGTEEERCEEEEKALKKCALAKRQASHMYNIALERQ